MENQWRNQTGNVNLTFQLQISIDAENRFYRAFLRPLDLTFNGPNYQEPIYIGAENEGAGDSSLVNNNTAAVGLINGNYSDGQSSTAPGDIHLVSAMLPMIPNASAQEFMTPVVSRELALQQDYFAAAAVPNASSQEFMTPVVSREPALQQQYFASAAVPPPPIPDLNVEFIPEDDSGADADAPPPPLPSPPIPDLNAEYRLEDNPTADATLPNGNVNVPAEGNADAVDEDEDADEDEDEDIVPWSRRKKTTGVIYYDPARRCSYCKTNDTPMWRKGPRGPHTLCNACGIQYGKRGGLPKKRKARSNKE